MSKTLSAIIAIYLLLSLTYLSAIPVGEAPDEPAHFLYAQHLADTGRPPDPPAPQRDSFWKNGFVTSNYEWHQPPLYYALAAAGLRVGRALFLPPYTDFPPINPDFPGPGRPLFVVVPPAWTEVHLARLLSVLLGGLTVWATAALARRLLPARPWLPEASAGFVAFLPQFTFLHAYVTNDALAILGGSLGLLALIDVATGADGPLTRRWLLAGGAVGLALAAKMTAWYLFPLGLLLLGIHFLTRRRTLAETAADLAAFVLPAGAALLASRLLWPDLFLRLLNSPQSSGIKSHLLSLAHFQAIFPMIHASFWGMFGWVNMPLADPLLWLLDGVLLIGLVGTVGWLIRHRAGLTGGQKRALFLLLCAVGAVVAAFVYFNLTAVQPQSRLLFPALPAVALAVGLGWLHWAGPYPGPATGALLALMLGVNLTGLLTRILPTYGLLGG